MRLLIAGYGNIGKAVVGLLKIHGDSRVSAIHICDKEIDGTTVQDWIKDNHQLIDLVVNLTGEPTKKILPICQKYNLDYIDTGLELTDGRVECHATTFQEISAMPSNVRTLIGFGMNPGIIEFIYHRCRPKRRHSAIEVEYDTAHWSSDGVFSTWSPMSYYLESKIYTPYYFAGDGLRILSSPTQRRYMTLCIDGVNRTFELMPHEEIISMGSLNPNCDKCAFLYQAPSTMQQFLRECAADTISSRIEGILTPTAGLQGEDIIGIMINGNHDSVSYHFNKAVHSEYLSMTKQLGIENMNGTSWQVACGVLIAIEILPHVRPGVYSMSIVAQQFSSMIEKKLADLRFEINCREFSHDEIRWENVKELLPD